MASVAMPPSIGWAGAGGLYDRALTATATIARTHHSLDPVLHRHDVQHFLDGLADLVKRSTAARADLALHIDHDIHARQMNRQHAAIAVGTWPRRFVGCAGFRIVSGAVRVLIRRACDDRRFISGQQQLQLISVHLLRSTAKQCPLVLRQDEQKLLVLLQCGVALGNGDVALVSERDLFRRDLRDDRRRFDELLLEKQRVGRQIIEANHAQNGYSKIA
jgi:hypothetical protein